MFEAVPLCTTCTMTSKLDVLNPSAQPGRRQKNLACNICSEGHAQTLKYRNLGLLGPSSSFACL